MLQFLAPRGVLLLTTPNRDFYAKDAVWRTDLPPVHTMWIGRKGVIALAARTGRAFQVKTLTDWYPGNENKLAKYLGCRRPFLPGSALKGKELFEARALARKCL
jgi:hypothetical protein